MNALSKEFQYYLDHQNELVCKYNGKVLVIKNQEIIAVYDSEDDAYWDTLKIHELGTFLIQKCTPGDEAYTKTFHSRIILA